MRSVRAFVCVCLAAVALPSAAPAQPTPVKAVPTGNYECWGNGEARLTLNFTITGSGTYRASDDSTGKFSFDAATGQVTFSGYLKDAMPDGFTAVYHEPKGVPTVSFRSRRGSEASFCERAKKK